jgi:hypothetical protein
MRISIIMVLILILSLLMTSCEDGLVELNDGFEVTGNGQEIPNGWAQEYVGNATDFGIVPLGGSVEVTYTINSLNGTAISFPSEGPAVEVYSYDEGWSVSRQPEAVESSQTGERLSTTFTVRCNPLEMGRNGDLDGIVHIRLVDPDRTFSFRIGATIGQGTIEILGRNGQVIPSTATVVFGDTLAGSSSLTSITISNTSTATGDLVMQSPAFRLDGANRSSFRIVEGNIAGRVLRPGTSLTIGIEFTPRGSDTTQNAVLRIRSNDDDRDPYFINLTGVRVPNGNG